MHEQLAGSRREKAALEVRMQGLEAGADLSEQAAAESAELRAALAAASSETTELRASLAAGRSRLAERERFYE